MNTNTYVGPDSVRAADSRFAPIVGTALYHLLLVLLLLFSSFDVYDLAIVLFLELCVIGLHALLRMLTAMWFGDPLSTENAHVSLSARIVLGFLAACFFVSKYGALLLGIGIAIILLPNEIGMSWAQQSEVHPMVEWCLYILLLRYGAMFVWDSIFRSDYSGESILRLLLFPYLRALWLAASFALGFILAALRPDDAQLYFAVGAMTVRFVPELIAATLVKETV